MSREATEAVVAKVETPAEIVKEKAIQKEVSLVELQTKEMVISSEEEYEKAAEFGKQIKEKAKVVTDFFKPMKDSAYQAHKAVCDREKTMLKPLQEAERILKILSAIHLKICGFFDGDGDARGCVSQCFTLSASNRSVARSCHSSQGGVVHR